MSGAVLKYISWYIDIPSIEDCKDDDEKSQVISTQFTMDQSVVDSCWFLKVHFNYQKSGKLAVFLCSPEGLSFCLKFTATILNQTTFTENKSATRATVYDDPDEPDMNGFVVSDLITLDELHNDDIGFEQDGKIHLVVVIRDTEWKIEDEGVDDESNTGNDLFTLMTRTDPSEIVTLRSSDGKEFNAYKSILTNKASILNLNARLQESPGIIEMEFKGAIVQEFLRYLSIGEVHTMVVVDSELYEMAKVYKVEELCKMCLSSIESRLCKENVIEYLKFSDKHELEDLFDACCTVLACSHFGKQLLELVSREFQFELQTRILGKLFMMWSTENGIFCRIQSVEAEESDYEDEEEEINDENYKAYLTSDDGLVPRRRKTKSAK